MTNRCLREATLHIDLPETAIDSTSQRHSVDSSQPDTIDSNTISIDEEVLLRSKCPEVMKELCARWVFGEKERAGQDARFVTHLSSQEAESPSFYLRLGALGIHSNICTYVCASIIFCTCVQVNFFVHLCKMNFLYIRAR